MGKEKLKKKKGTLLFTNELGKFERLNLEELKILINRSVQGLAPVTVVEKRKKRILQVEATGWYPLTAYMNSAMDAETALAFIWNTLRIAFDCERYGLRVDNLCWDPAKVFVDQQGTLTMVYWPVTTLEQSQSNALGFYGSFCGVLQNSDIDPQIANQYYAYFYQRDYFDFNRFYQMIQEILERWRQNKFKEQKAQQKVREREQIDALRPDRQSVISSGWLERPDTQQKITLDKAETTFGRDGTVCTVAIPNFDGVSRRHAMIVNKDNQYFVMDLGSRNGTYVQGIRLSPNQQTALNDGDTVRFGNATYIFRKMNLNQTVSIHQIQRR